MNISDRFFKSVNSEAPNGCWEWTACCNTRGYGQFYVDGKAVMVHRWFYCTLTGKTPDVVMHKCNNKKCVNPKHLKGATQKENMQHMRDNDTQRFNKHPRAPSIPRPENKRLQFINEALK